MNCQPRSRTYLSGPEIFWLIVDKVGVVGGSFWDIPFQLPFPCNTFFIGAIKTGDEANSIMMSFILQNKPRGFSFSNLTGTEQLFPMTSSNLAIGPHLYSVLTFKEPSQLVYFNIGSENGNLSRYSIGCVGSTGFKIKGGLYF